MAIKNVFGSWLGKLLKEKRLEKGYTLGYVGQELGSFNASYVRMIESGATLLSSSRVFEMIHGFDEIFEIPVVYPSLSQYLCFMSSLPKDSNLSITSYIKEKEPAVDSQMRSLLSFLISSGISELIDEEKYDDALELLGGERAIRKLELFLIRSEENGMKNINNRYDEIYMKTPSPLNIILEDGLNQIERNIDLATKYKQTYSLDEWEKVHQDKVSKMYAVLDNIYQITEFDTTNLYDWSYFKNEVFKEFNCFLVDSGRFEIDKEKLIQFIIKNMRIDGDAKKIIKTIIPKIKVHGITRDSYRNLFSDLLLASEDIYESWHYKVSRNNQEDLVGFYYTNKIDKGVSRKDKEKSRRKNLEIYLGTNYSPMSNPQVKNIHDKVEELLNKNKHA